MCGIAGIVDPSGAPVDRGTLARMTRTLAPRGPDGEGLWHGPGVGLGHRRLAVLDLSEAGRQPMGNEDGGIQVVFNGELYNFVELRAELTARGHRFVSRTDTEVLVHGYEEWGDAVVERIDGMFAFALWDARARRLLCARDRMGKKPLYWAQLSRDGGRPPLFVFGSELKALLQVPGLERRIEPRALASYLAFEYVPPPATIFTGVHKLDAGQRLVLEAGGAPRDAPAIHRYWDLPFPERHEPMRPEEAAEELRRLLTQAVRRRLVADVPLGVFLSGGLDSSSVAATMTELAGAGRVRSFSIGFWDRSHDETEHARVVARHLGTDHQIERLDPGALLRALPEVARFLDEPLGDASILPTFLLARFARRHVTVALGGDGSDELFAGYPTFKAERLARVYDRLPSAAHAALRWAAARLPAGTGYFSFDFKVHQFLRGGAARGPLRHQRWMCSLLPEEQVGLLQAEILQAVGDDLLAPVTARAATSPARDPRDLLMDFYCRFYLPGDYNVKVDRASSAVGLEVRAPFLDTDLVTFACHIPPELRLHRWTSKHVLKQAMRDRLPPSIVQRGKQGFGVPVARWMREELREEVQEALSPARLRRDGWFRPEPVQRLLQEHLSGRRDRRKALWTLLTFQRWLDVWGPGAPGRV